MFRDPVHDLAEPRTPSVPADPRPSAAATAAPPAAATPSHPAVAPPRTWLLRTGWRRHGLIRVDETPRPATQ